MFHFKKRFFLPVCLLALSTPVPSFATIPLEWSLEGGPAWFHSSDAVLGVTEIESDTLHPTKYPTMGEMGLGVSYRIPLNLVSETQSFAWFNQISPGLNLRYTGFSDNTVRGIVQQFQQSNLDNYNYRLSLENIRLMAEVRLNVVSWRQTSLILTGGVGEGWTRLNYHDYPNPAIAAGGLSLLSHHQSKFVSEIGAGINYSWSERWSFSLSYLLTHYNHLSTSTSGFLDTQFINVAPAEFSLNSQATLLGIHFKV